MVALDFSIGTELETLDLSDLPPLDGRERPLVLSTWRGRMVNEHVSAQVFAGLIPQAMRAGLAPGLQAELATMVADELRHARQCAAVVTALGERPIAEQPEIHVLPEHPDGDRVVAFLRNILSVCCLSETVAVALIDGERRDLDPAPTGQVLRRILADEVRHARFGWRVFEQIAPELTPEARSAVAAYVPTALEHLVEHELAHLSPLAAPSRAAQLAGACDGENARHIFFDTVEQVIVPGLDRLGLGGAESWARVQRRGSARSSSARVLSSEARA